MHQMARQLFAQNPQLLAPNRSVYCKRFKNMEPFIFASLLLSIFLSFAANGAPSLTGKRCASIHLKGEFISPGVWGKFNGLDIPVVLNERSFDESTIKFEKEEEKAEGVLFRVVEPTKGLSALNDVAYALLHGDKTKGVRLGVSRVPDPSAFYSKKSNVIVLGTLDPAVVAHEIRHVYFEKLLSMGQVGEFHGEAGQSFQELYNYPLTLRSVSSDKRLTVAKEFRDVLNPQPTISVEGRDVPGYPSKVTVDILRSYRQQPGSFTFEFDQEKNSILLRSPNQESISIGPSSREKNIFVVRVYRVYHVSESFQFWLENPSAFIAELPTNPRKLSAFLEIALERARAIDRLYLDLSIWNDFLISRLERGEDGNLFVSKMIEAVREAAKVRYPLNRRMQLKMSQF